MKKLLIVLTFLVFAKLSGFAQAVDKPMPKVWQQFEANYGPVVLQWKAGFASPHRVICTPIKLADVIANEKELESLLRIFLEQNRTMFQIENAQLKLASIYKARKIWYANFVQTHEGKDILNSEVVFRVHENGQLIVFGMDHHPIVDVNHSNLQSSTELFLKLKTLYTGEDLTIQTQQSLKILPLIKEGEFTYKTVYISAVSNNRDVNELVYTDAHTLETLKIINRVHHQNITGNVQGKILPVLATDTPEPRIFENLHLNINGDQVTTDELGNFDYTFTGDSTTLNAQLKGPYVDVSHFSGSDASITQMVDQNDFVNLLWDNSNSTLQERNVFYHINEIHKKNKALDPNFTFLDYPLPCIVDDNAATCNAYFNGTTIHFNVEGTNCSMNSAHGASVVYHEYGHAINDRIYNQVGINTGLGNQALQEAFADIYSCLLLDDSRFALGWFGPNTFTRNLNNNNTYPGSIVGQPHTDGLILGGAFWDLRLLTSPELAYELAHFAKYGTPDDSDLGMAYSEVYIETLIADDDDGNLMNGTPNSAAIENAFCQHGIGSNLFAVQQVSHQPLSNSLDETNDNLVEISLSPSPFIPNTLGEMSLIYTTNNFNNTNTVAFTEVNNNNYAALIPAQVSGTLIKYYFKIQNGNCGTMLTHPSRDFINENYSFYIGDYTTVFEDDFDTVLGWQLGDASDNASSGLWQRANPQEVIDNESFVVQPEQDHSDTGIFCLVTGATKGTFWYSNDVDGGKTTVTSPVFDFINESSIVTFYKWFVHGAGFLYPAQGQWLMEVSNDGTSWAPVEVASYGDHRHWIKSSYRIFDLVDITDNIQFRFTVSDIGTGSIVEALVDDFTIVNLESFVAIPFEENSPDISVYPNPVNDEIYITFEDHEATILSIELFSITGQLISLTSQNSVNSNGTYIFSRGATIPGGIYLLKVTTGTSTLTKKLIFR